MNDIKQIVESAVLENGIYVARTGNGVYKFPPKMREEILKRKPLPTKKQAKYQPSKIFQEYLSFVDKNKDIIPLLILIKEGHDFSELRKKGMIPSRFMGVFSDFYDSRKRYQTDILISMLPVFPKAWFNQGE